MNLMHGKMVSASLWYCTETLTLATYWLPLQEWFMANVRGVGRCVDGRRALDGCPIAHAAMWCIVMEEESPIHSRLFSVIGQGSLCRLSLETDVPETTSWQDDGSYSNARTHWSWTTWYNAPPLIQSVCRRHGIQVHQSCDCIGGTAVLITVCWSIAFSCMYIYIYIYMAFIGGIADATAVYMQRMRPWFITGAETPIRSYGGGHKTLSTVRGRPQWQRRLYCSHCRPLSRPLTRPIWLRGLDILINFFRALVLRDGIK